ncbi:SseB family protein [Streptomyces orinoci]|uniref:SseB family protein n=1 Tax=Streptomyces orinoci TaxID=67339 RepID=A0ABV3JSS0_STRON|nr:SseB family protein [Streptomyces orinoci]
MSLTDELTTLYAQQGNPRALLGEFRRTEVLIPVHSDSGDLMSVTQHGICWILAFTGESALAHFVLAQTPEGTEPPDIEYRTAHGARLLDVAVPATGVPTGVALDLAGPYPMLFPPVMGVVPDDCAVDNPDLRVTPEQAARLLAEMEESTS